MLSASRLTVLRGVARPARSLATHASSSFFPDEPSFPKIVTSTLPGPKSIEASNEIGLFQDNRTHIFIAG
jgi:4-aminobutyrate aminotransferase/(S)-3-amino-2-methylpropionate transaminase